MTFSEATRRLPAPSYTVQRDGDNVLVWLLYYQDATDIADPKAESGPRVEVEGANVLRWGEEFGMHHVGDFMRADRVPDPIRESEWKAAEAGRGASLSVESPAAKVYALNGFSVEEAKAQDEWPKEIQALR